MQGCCLQFFFLHIKGWYGPEAAAAPGDLVEVRDIDWASSMWCSANHILNAETCRQRTRPCKLVTWIPSRIPSLNTADVLVTPVNYWQFNPTFESDCQIEAGYVILQKPQLRIMTLALHWGRQGGPKGSKQKWAPPSFIRGTASDRFKNPMSSVLEIVPTASRSNGQPDLVTRWLSQNCLHTRIRLLERTSRSYVSRPGKDTKKQVLLHSVATYFEN